jgi:dGTPase
MGNMENPNLAEYAVSSSETKGRRYPETEHPLRTPFQRDRDRIIHSTAFRRLEYKTQVFIYYEGDYYRNRLTHTLEVQQLARTVARVLNVNEDLVEAISLAHDLGHTPFGHKGENVLDEIMKELGYEGFEHNSHGLKVVDEIERRISKYPGLNLTYEVREGIIRHTTSYDVPRRKGMEEFTQFPSPSVETQIVSLCDEIAYTCHDLDDGIKSEVIKTSALKHIVLWKEVEEMSKDNSTDLGLKRRLMVRNFINYLVSDLVEQSRKNIKNSAVKNVEEVRKSNSYLISHSEAMKTKHTELRKFLEDNMYFHYRVIRMAQKAARVIRDLFYAYLAEPRQMPPGTQTRLEKEPKEIVICDYIAGMTDRFAHLEHQKLFDPHISV